MVMCGPSQDNPLPEVPDSVIDEVCAGLHEPTEKTGVTERPPEHGELTLLPVRGGGHGEKW